MSAKSGSLSIACVQLGPQKLSVIRRRVAGCPLFRDCLSIEVNGRAIGTFRIVRYIVGVRYSVVSVKRGSTVCNIHCICVQSNLYMYYDFTINCAMVYN